MPNKLVSTERNYGCGMGMEYVVQMVIINWNECTQAAGLESIQIGLQHYIFINICTVVFEDIGS